ncbi:uncharacterized protein N7446_005011 [Penicillium canescens]|uniref:F-box domain-containing protein n=1 Tax=Penicillium canescens TaxID=5083 RepID=A0AAD6I105_PENCN|nr:uncharacterized protein N7446_005011 [Penicillium canescens]KAJ6026388.1 hypothetical protein N7460_011205 [Penicillium canescens]KAJ6039678.1 hypothetical protein N7444_008583 [Penicillium canescens]KAJ6067974.1 hypothetical protein N7446_005011 [Penicillium canescens]
MPTNIRARSRQTFARVHSTHFPQPPQRDTKKIADSIAYSTVDVHEINTIPPLLALPSELLLKILGNLQDLQDLFSTILACRRIFDIFQEAQRLLIESTFAKYIRLKTDRGIYQVLIQLGRIIRRDIVHRDVVRHVFETGWEVFRQRHQEELLIPFGRAIAWSYVLNNRQADAVCLLQLIQKGEPPFGWSEKFAQPPIQPIRELLGQLVSEENGVDRKYISSDLDHPLVEIKRKSNSSASCLNHIEQSALLKDGILFRENSIVMRKSTPYPPRVSSKHMFHYNLFRHGSISNETMNRDVMKALAHQPTDSYAGGGQHRSLRNL